VCTANAGDVDSGPLVTPDQGEGAGSTHVTPDQGDLNIPIVIISSGDNSRDLPFTDPERLSEINKTLDRIESGGPFPYEQDGTTFKNYEKLLPIGSYREYTVDTPNLTHRGMRSVLVDQETGKTYYTDDHYRSFVEIKR
jgi:guanyl-specific ribonuclease Sa